MIARRPAPTVLRVARRRRASFAVAGSGATGLLVLLLLALPASSGAQGLGDAASRERARRHAEADEEKKKAPAKVFTNDDLKASGEDASAEASDQEAGATEDSAAGLAGPDREEDVEFRERADRERAERAAKEREWRARFAEARARVREEEARGWRDVVRTELYQGLPVQMKVKEFVETEEFRQAKKALADLQEEFRRTGLPPGWSRE